MLPLERLVAAATLDDRALRGGEVFDISVDLICAQEIGGVEALYRPFMHTSPARLVGKRADRLVILFLVEVPTATAEGFYERQIERAEGPALIVPPIISSGQFRLSGGDAGGCHTAGNLLRMDNFSRVACVP